MTVTLECGCRSDGRKIHFCDLHKAAPDLLDAVTLFLSWYNQSNPRLERAINKARSISIKANPYLGEK